MENKSMTALVSAFSRAYHARNHRVKIFDDTLAEKLLLEEEYAMISKSMAQGAQFFFPGFEGSEAEALGRIVDAQLSPTPLGRTAFAQSALKTAVSIGARQYVILGAGYDTFAYRQPDWARSLELFELEQPATSRDKRERLARAAIEIPPNVHFIETDLNDPRWAEALWRHPAFDADKLTFCSLLGLVYYLSKESFGALLSELGTRLCKGSSLVLITPTRTAIPIGRESEPKSRPCLRAARRRRCSLSTAIEPWRRF